MNIKFIYQYRDSANYKNWDSVVFSNPNNISLDKIDNQLCSLFISGEFFIAHQIDIKELFFYKEKPVSSDDHCYHEYVGVEFTKETVTDTRFIEEFISEIKHAFKKGWVAFSPVDHFLS